MNDPDTKRITKEAMLVLCKATEKFIQYMGEGAAASTLSHKRKTILIGDVHSICHSDPILDFLKIEFPNATLAEKKKDNKVKAPSKIKVKL